LPKSGNFQTFPLPSPPQTYPWSDSYPLLEQRANASFSKTLAAGPDATISSEISTAQTSEQLKSITTNTSDCKMPSYI